MSYSKRIDSMFASRKEQPAEGEFRTATNIPIQVTSTGTGTGYVSIKFDYGGDESPIWGFSKVDAEQFAAYFTRLAAALQ